MNWLDAATKTKRSFNNKRTSIIRLFKYAKLQGYLPDDRMSEAELVLRKKKLPIRDVHALPLGTLRTLFDKAMEAGNHEAALYYAFGSQTGMRTSELQKFQWEHCKIKRGLIDLPKWVTKNRQARQIPMSAALVAWIDTLGGPGKGKVFSSTKATNRSIDFARPFMPPKPASELPDDGETAEADWWENCMRDSYGSYRAVTTKHVGLVALEMGTSEAMIKRCYFDRQADEADGWKWFSTGPEGWNPPKSAAGDAGEKTEIS